MEAETAGMIDAAFDLEGNAVPANYPFALWDGLVRILPWLAEEATAGVLPLRGSLMGEELLLPRRARLVLRLPVLRISQVAALAGQELDIEGCSLRIGRLAERALQPYSTLHAQLVESSAEEGAFLSMVAERLGEMGVNCRWICGRRQTLSAPGLELSGYSLVLHDLKPGDSLRLQREGLGEYRRYCCGVFVPHKEIAGLD